jgi:hypothetical protein
MDRKRLFITELQAMVITIVLLLVSLSVPDISVALLRTSLLLSIGLVRISGLVPVVPKQAAQREGSARSNAIQIKTTA